VEFLWRTFLVLVIIAVGPNVVECRERDNREDKDYADNPGDGSVAQRRAALEGLRRREIDARNRFT
jgi:hypothetical protein